MTKDFQDETSKSNVCSDDLAILALILICSNMPCTVECLAVGTVKMGS